MAHGGIDNVLKYMRSLTSQSMENLQMVYPALRFLITNSNKTKILINSILAMKSLIEHNNEYVLKLINDGVVPYLIKKLKDSTSSTVSLDRAVCNILFNIAPRADEQLQFNIISNFSEIMNHSDRSIRSGAVQCLAKMAAGSYSSRQIIMEAQLLPDIFENLSTSDSKTQKQTKALFTDLISNADQNQTKKLFGVKVINALCSLIKSKATDIIAVSILMYCS